MQLDLDSLRRHYRSLPDDELLAMERDELTEAAQRCYDEELAERGLTSQKEEPAGQEYGEADYDTEEEADWLPDAACACSFVSQPGGSAATDAGNARGALQDAGIPCQVSVVEVTAASGDQPAQHEYRVMVPGALNLIATSILDKEVFNPQLEADWRTHFEELSDEELRALHPDVICAGLVDRIARLKRAYTDELARRAKGSSA
jgi:hypothetical protein